MMERGDGERLKEGMGRYKRNERDGERGWDDNKGTKVFKMG